MKNLNQVIGFILLSIFASCELPKLERPTNCPNKPTAKFMVSQENCDLPCGVTITNESTNARSYEWFVDDKLFNTQKELANLIFSTPGLHKIKLLVSSESGCLDSMLSVIQVSNVANFERPYNFTTNDVFPLGASELKSRNIQVLYREGTRIKSSIFDNLGNINPASIKEILTSISLSGSNVTALKNGEFLLAGSSSSNAMVFKIDSTQNIAPSPNKSFQFTSSTNSIAQKAIISSGGETLVTGFRNATNSIVGFSRIDRSNSLLAAPIVTDDSALKYKGISLAESPTGVFVLAESTGNTSAAKLFSLSINGAYNRNLDIPNLFFPRKILALGGGQFAVIGRDNLSKCQLYYTNGTSIGSTLALTVNDVYDMVLLSNNSLLICGTRNNGIRVAKTSVNGTIISYTDFAPPISTNSLIGVSISETQFGGYIVLSQYLNAGKKELHLIKSN